MKVISTAEDIRVHYAAGENVSELISDYIRLAALLGIQVTHHPNEIN